MKGWMRNLKYWGIEGIKGTVQVIGLSIALLVILVVIAPLKLSLRNSNIMEGGIMIWISVFPYYLTIVGSIILLTLAIASIMHPYPTVLSLNARRGEAFLGMSCMFLIIILGICAASFLIWNWMPGEIAEGGRNLLWALTGAMFAVSGISILLGLVYMRWNKVGIIVFTLMGGLIGGVFGISLSAGNKVFSFLSFLDNVMGRGKWILAIGGTAVFIIANIIGYLAVRKYEIKA